MAESRHILELHDDPTCCEFDINGRQFFAIADEEPRYWLVYEAVGNRAEFLSKELLQPGMSRESVIATLHRYTRVNVTYSEVLAAEAAISP